MADTNKNTNKANLGAEATSENTTPVTYTEQQVQEIYNEAQKSGYIAAIKQVRNEITEYLNELIVRVQQGK